MKTLFLLFLIATVTTARVLTQDSRASATASTSVSDGETTVTNTTSISSDGTTTTATEETTEEASDEESTQVEASDGGSIAVAGGSTSVTVGNETTTESTVVESSGDSATAVVGTSTTAGSSNETTTETTADEESEDEGTTTSAEATEGGATAEASVNIAVDGCDENRSEKSRSVDSGDGATASASVSTSVSCGPTAPAEESTDSTTATRIDVYLLVDTTKSMKLTLRELKQNRDTLVEEIFGLDGDVSVGVGQYKDKRDNAVFGNILFLESNQTAVLEAIQSLRPYGGGITKKEAQLYALETVATDSSIGFHTSGTKVIVWVGDQPAKDPILDSTEESATTALIDGDIHVIAVDVGRLNRFNQARRIANATGGAFRKVDHIRSRTTAVTAADEGSTAFATGTGDSVTVSAQAGDESASATNSDGPSLTEIIVDALQAVLA